MFKPNVSDDEGSVALRNFFNELFQERAAASGHSSDADSDSYDSDSVSLSSDEETVDDLAKSTHSNDLTSGTQHTRRRRFRNATSQRIRRPIVAVSPDNAAGIRRGSKTELSISSYHNPLNNNGVSFSRNFMRSNSAHSLGSRTEISRTSVGVWRNSLQKQRLGLPARINHKESRWSTDPVDIPSNKPSSGIKQYDFGFVNDSVHVQNNRRTKKSSKKKTNAVPTRRTPKGRLHLTHLQAIDSAVQVLDSSSDEDSSDGEEFFDDDVESLTSFAAESFVSSRATNGSEKSSTIGTSLDFGSRFKTKSKSIDCAPRVAPSRTKSGSDIPRLPRRTCDDSFFDFGETYEPLKGNSSSHHRGFQKSKLRRTVSEDVSTLSSCSSINAFDKVAKQESSDLFGRWAANSHKNDTNLCSLALPRRPPSLSSRTQSKPKKPSEGKLLKKVTNRSTGRYSNHSNDSSEPSDSDSDSDDSCEFHDSFAYDDDNSLAATVATTGSSSKGNGSYSTSSTFDKGASLKFFSSLHSHRPAFPAALCKLPHHSFHGGSTISSKSATRAKRQHPGKILRTTSRA